MIELAEVIRELRTALTDAMAAGQQQELRFEVAAHAPGNVLEVEVPTRWTGASDLRSKPRVRLAFVGVVQTRSSPILALGRFSPDTLTDSPSANKHILGQEYPVPAKCGGASVSLPGGDPVQMIELIVIGAIIAIAGGAALNWKKLQILLKGKRIAVLGARTVGKTHLIQFLSAGSIPASYKQTVAPEKKPGKRLQLRDLEIVVKDTLDLPGSESAYAQWERQVAESAVILYLVRVDHLKRKHKATCARVLKDVGQIGRWLQDSNNMNKRLYIVGTFADKDPEYLTVTPSTLGTYLDEFEKLDTVQEMVARAGGYGRVTVILGSMKDVPSTEGLVYELFSQILKVSK